MQFERGLVIATHNQGKLAEFADLLAPFHVTAHSAAEHAVPEPEETGTTFQENAELKAVHSMQHTGLPALADDSGICVDALDGEPGIYSARWGGPKRDFFLAMQKIEDLLQQKRATSPTDRQAKFVAVLCLVVPDQAPQFFRGEIAGTLIWPPRGDQGFGYDPMFLPEGYAITFGQMNAGQKHNWKPGQRALSHRARAFQKFAQACLSAD